MRLRTGAMSIYVFRHLILSAPDPDALMSGYIIGTSWNSRMYCAFLSYMNAYL